MKKLAMFSPCIVNSAFSIKLYLKCGYALENNGKLIREHNLFSLYKSLSLVMQNNITALWDKHVINNKAKIEDMDRGMQPSIMDIEHVLSEASNAFVSFRYMYEGQGLGLTIHQFN